jgi:ABC-type uncharacterized transport system ATPase subunit
MDIVRRIAKKVTVLAQGKMLAEGMLEEVVANKQVQDVYLGRGR